MGSVDQGKPIPAPLVKDIAIVGAGPCGLAAAKYLKAQGCFGEIVIYEQQAEVGGVWNYSPEPSDTLHVPQVNPLCPPDPPLRQPGKAPVFPSPMYELLHTNIPLDLMNFTDKPFKRDALAFPSRDDVQEHLLEYARDVRELVRFSVQVKDIRLRQEDGKDRWDIEAASTISGETLLRTFDGIVVASGHYATTYMPDIKGIADFHKAHPNVITHSNHYRTPDRFSRKKVVVVGNAASGVDVAAQISRVCKKPLLLSVRHATPEDALEYIGADEIPEIKEFLVAEKGVRLADRRVETDVDAVIFATGYLYGFPFLKSLEKPLVTDGRRVYGLWKEVIYTEHPTIVFPGLPMKVVPFAISESQSAIIARVWSGELELPSKEEMRRWEEEQAKKRGDAYHVYPNGGDGKFINETAAWLAASGTSGKPPPFWTDELIWQRAIFRDAKLAFEKTGRTARSLEELGFRYEPPEARAA